MSTNSAVMEKQMLTRKSFVRMGIGAVIGAAFGYSFVAALTHLHISLKRLTWSDFLAYWLGVTYLGVGIALFAITYNRKQLARNLEGEEAKLPATDDEVRIFRLQSLTIILAGVLILIPLLAMGTIGSTPQRAGAVFTVVAALWLLQTWINWKAWRRADEFARLLLLKATAITFAICQGALFLWAAAEHLGLAHPITSWDSMMLLMTVYLIASMTMGIKYRPGS